jgi:hypothetical protein
VPLQDWNLRSTFDGAYGSIIRSPPGEHSGVPIHVHYLRSALRGVAIPVAAYFDSYLGPAAYNQRFVIVGGGFGWIADELLDRGFTNIVVAETSQYILDNMDLDDEADVRDACEAAGYDRNSPGVDALVGWFARTGVPRRRRGQVAEDVPIVSADISTPQGRNAAKSVIGGNPQIVVSEDVIGTLSDAEAIQFAADCQKWGGQQTVVHLVTTLDPDASQDPGYNWKTLADWKLLIPSDIFIDAVTGEVLE